VLERKVLFVTNRCIWSDRLIGSLGHLMETCISKLIVSVHKLYNIINLLKKSRLGVCAEMSLHSVQIRGVQVFKKNIGARRLTLSQFHKEDRNIRGTTIQDFIARES